MGFIELNDNERIELVYGYKMFRDRQEKKKRKNIPTVGTLYTNIYTDGEIVSYEENEPYEVDYYIINGKKYNSVNLLQRDTIKIKNHTFVIKQVLADEWVNYCGRTLMPVVKDTQIFVKDKENFLSLIKPLLLLKNISDEKEANPAANLFGEGNTYLRKYNDITIDENSRVHMLSKKQKYNEKSRFFIDSPVEGNDNLN